MWSVLRRGGFFATVLVLLTVTFAAGAARASERLTYKVHYGPFRLGTVWYELPGPHVPGDELRVLRMEARSNPGLPFVDTHTFFESHVDSSGKPVRFISRDISGPDTLVNDYVIRRDVNLLLLTRSLHTRDRVTVQRDTIVAHGPTYDGLALIQMSATRLDPGDTTEAWSFFGQKYGPVEVVVDEEPEVEHVDALGRDVALREVRGEMGFKGFVGMTGRLSGMRMEEAPHRYVSAAMGIFLGSVRLSLEQVERNPGSELVERFRLGTPAPAPRRL